jgi:hypothetical protein
MRIRIRATKRFWFGAAMRVEPGDAKGQMSRMGHYRPHPTRTKSTKLERAPSLRLN